MTSTSANEGGFYLEALDFYIVTLKLPRNPKHNPHEKVTGPCPVTRAPCTDVTGEHHSILLQAHSQEDAAQIARISSGTEHVTRVERVGSPPHED